MQWCGNSELYQSEPCTLLYTSPGLHFKRVSRSGLIWQCMAHAGCQPLWLLCGKARNPGPIMSLLCTCTCKGTAWKGKENTGTIYSSRLALLLAYNCHLPMCRALFNCQWNQSVPNTLVIAVNTAYQYPYWCTPPTHHPNVLTAIPCYQQQ